MTSADYAIQAVNGIKESFDNDVKESLDMYRDNRIIDFYNTTEVFEIFTSTEGLTGSKELGELETPPVTALEDGYSVTIHERRFGGAIILSEKMYRRDGGDTTLKVDTYLARQASALVRNNVNLFLTNSFELLNDAFSGSTYLAPDGAAICGSHTWKSGGTFDNGVTAILNESSIDSMMEYAGAFTSPDGKPMPLNFNTIVVKKGSANARAAKKLFAMSISPVAVGDINIYQGEFTIVETPYITYANRNFWFAIDSTLENPLKVGIGEYPTMREPIRESNEAIRSNVTGFYKIACVNMPYAVYGSNGTTS